MRRGSTFWGAVLLVAGALLLMQNMGILTINVWQILWPIVIILFGLWFLLRSTTGPKSIPVESFQVPLEGASRLRLTLHFGAGRLHLGRGSSPADAVGGTFQGGLLHDVSRQGADLKVDLRVPTDDVLDLIPWGANTGLNWDLGLSDSVEVELSIEAGASENHVDLTGLNVPKLTFKTGASDTRILFSERAENAQAEISLGAASAKLTVPQAVSASIRIKSGLTGIKIDEHRFPRQGDTYQSPDFGTAAHRLTMRVEAGVGSVEIL